VNVETREKIYIDPDTIRRKGDIAEMWVLYDSKTAQPAGVARLLIQNGSE
jgi:hypothetical protein